MANDSNDNGEREGVCKMQELFNIKHSACIEVYTLWKAKKKKKRETPIRTWNDDQEKNVWPCIANSENPKGEEISKEPQKRKKRLIISFISSLQFGLPVVPFTSSTSSGFSFAIVQYIYGFGHCWRWQRTSEAVTGGKGYQIAGKMELLRGSLSDGGCRWQLALPEACPHPLGSSGSKFRHKSFPLSLSLFPVSFSPYVCFLVCLIRWYGSVVWLCTL